jgi:hypothetical protein
MGSHATSYPRWTMPPQYSQSTITIISTADLEPFFRKGLQSDSNLRSLYQVVILNMTWLSKMPKINALTLEITGLGDFSSGTISLYNSADSDDTDEMASFTQVVTSSSGLGSRHK